MGDWESGDGGGCGYDCWAWGEGAEERDEESVGRDLDLGFFEAGAGFPKQGGICTQICLHSALADIAVQVRVVIVSGVD